MVPIPLETPLLGLAEEHPSGFLIVPHQHDVPQLIYATQGVMTVETEQGAWVVPPQRAVWVPDRVVHSISMTGAVHFRTLYVKPRLAPIRTRDCGVVQVSDLLRACITRFFEFEEGWGSDRSRARVANVLLDEIRGAPTAPLYLPMPQDARALRVATEFREDPSSRRTIQDWAKFAGMSERSLERLWPDQVQITFGRWQQQARLLRALELLATGSSVTEVALAVGFETASSFIEMFRRTMDTTPKRYFKSP